MQPRVAGLVVAKAASLELATGEAPPKRTATSRWQAVVTAAWSSASGYNVEVGGSLATHSLALRSGSGLRQAV